jgi:hypothetical protein
MLIKASAFSELLQLSSDFCLTQLNDEGEYVLDFH